MAKISSLDDLTQATLILLLVLDSGGCCWSIMVVIDLKNLNEGGGGCLMIFSYARARSITLLQ